MIAESINDRDAREVLLEKRYGDVNGSQVGSVVLGPHVMRRKITSHIPATVQDLLTTRTVI